MTEQHIWAQIELYSCKYPSFPLDIFQKTNSWECAILSTMGGERKAHEQIPQKRRTRGTFSRN
jgi:hypothetical protein